MFGFIIIIFFALVCFIIMQSISDNNKIRETLEEYLKTKKINPELNFTVYKKRIYLTWDSKNKCIIWLKKENVNSAIEEKIYENYNCCKLINCENSLCNSVIYVDNFNRKILIADFYTDVKIKEIKIDDILEMSIVADFKNSSKRSTLSTIGRATVGGVISGGVGSLVGASTASIDTKSLCTFLSLKLKLNNLQEPNFYVNMFQNEDGIVSINQSEIYKKTLELQDTISVILNQMSVDESKSKKNISGSSENCEADELFRLVELRKNNFITEEEFEILKKKIINN